LIVETELDAEPDLPADHKEALYRVAQEIFHNIVKHANARTVLLRLTTQNGLHLLEIHDDGKGFDPAVSFPGHFGLLTMQERIAKIGGTLTIESAVGKGTSIRARIGPSPNKGAKV
jgi:signal transduction histidine kinase